MTDQELIERARKWIGDPNKQYPIPGMGVLYPDRKDKVYTFIVNGEDKPSRGFAVYWKTEKGFKRAYYCIPYESGNGCQYVSTDCVTLIKKT